MAEEMRANRGTLTEPGTNSPYRERTVAENLDLFERMKNGEFPDGAKVLRAKIDMASANINLRDPVIYRIIHMHHHRSGDQWCIYPMYDWAHGQSDSLEGVTHSCVHTNFNNRPLYGFIEQEFSLAPDRICNGNITYTALSKRYIREMMEQASYATGRPAHLHPTRPAQQVVHPVRRFWRRSALQSAITTSISPYSNTVCATSSTRQHAPNGVLRPLKVVIEEYPSKVSYSKPSTTPKTARVCVGALLSRALTGARTLWKTLRELPGVVARARRAC